MAGWFDAAISAKDRDLVLLSGADFGLDIMFAECRICWLSIGG